MAVSFLLQLIFCAVFFSLLLSVMSESNSKSSFCSDLFVGSSGSDSMSFMRTLREGQTLVSSGGRFVFGFFSPGGISGRRYLGVCYWNLSSPVVWVANRDRPITGAGELELTATGILVLYDDTGLIWRVNPIRAARRPILQLLDSGNLVLRDATGEDGYLWQSFDHPCNILLPGMKLGWDLRTGRQRNMTSWRSWDDPAAGDLTLSLESPELPQLVLRIAGETENRWGPWDGSEFSGANPNPNFKQSLISSHEEVYYTFSVPDGPVVPVMLELNQEGLVSYLSSNEEWLKVATFPKDSCDRYGSCGPNGYCYYHDHEPNCRCFDGFVPKYRKDWGSMDWSGGCTRTRRLSYGNGDGFVRFSGLKLPDHPRPPKDHNKLSQRECEMECLANSSCTAYTVVGFGCVVWLGDLLDMRTFPFGGHDIYIRMSPQEIESINHEKRIRQIKITLFITMSVVCMMCVLVIIGWKVITVLMENRRAGEETELPVEPENHGEAANQDGMDQLSLYDMATLSVATNQFSASNKIGQGGFGLVYKGVLPNGQAIAVKRLSRSTSQGLQQFKNEVVLIAKLQHRNLVRLLGCCIQGEERILIYEYMPNKSLDYFLFDKSRSHLLTWETRFNIIIGIARGLLYLHEDSRLRIIHRDLKTSNILLDNGMVPKISDFGIASIFGGDQTEEMTRRVLGTYGYMSPEYAIRGHFSIKSDVFSFGVLLLEVISGTNNWSFRHPDHNFNLLGHAWKLWNEGNVLELVDPFMEASICVEKVMRCIQVGLLCVQQRTDDRPIISSIIFMLSNETTSMPQPKEPGFFSGSSYSGAGYMEPWSGEQNICTTELTISDIQGR